ncbi:MAG TPA: hypothetical protein VGN34_25695 [Ktedonobacteraceae bacterium]
MTNNERVEMTTDEVTIDTEQGSYIAGVYLTRLGHRRIGCIAGPDDANAWTKRVQGFYRALGEVGIAPDPRAIAYGNARYDSGRKEPSRILLQTKLIERASCRALAHLITQQTGVPLLDDKTNRQHGQA